MFRWLRTGNPYHALILLVYAIAVKYYFLVHPLPAVLMPASDGLLYTWLTEMLGHWLSVQGFAIAAFVVLFAEALLVNTLLNRFRVLPGNTYFPAFCFLLFSSFFEAWNRFSAPLVCSLVLVALLAELLQLYTTDRSRSKSFSLGFLGGVAALIYLPAVILLVVIWVALLISRPFRLAEWILAVAGMACPVYFLATALFLTGRLSLVTALPAPAVSYPHLTTAYWLGAGIALVIGWFLVGSIRLQQDYMKLMIHIRKCWQILLGFVCVGVALPFFAGTFAFAGWLAAFLPMTAFIALAFLGIRRPWLQTVVHLSALAYIVLSQWVY